MPPVVAHFHCLAIEGIDARRFAQTQFSGDVDALAPDRWQWNAWLNAQGRVQALMQLVDAGDGRLLGVLRGGDARAIHAALARYLLRSKAKLTIHTLTARAAGPLPSGSVQWAADSMVLGFGERSLRLTPDEGAIVDPSANAQWRLADIRAGWPMLAANAQPKFSPPALGLERLGAVAFDKGCYPGQEIAARLHYRGGHKHRLYHVSGTPPLPVGDIHGLAGNSVQASILDTVSHADGSDSLAVVGVDANSEINILGNLYTINKKFDA
jgi:folate-binding protein YgfZ